MWARLAGPYGAANRGRRAGGNMASIGPVEYVVIGFPGNRAKARILAT